MGSSQQLANVRSGQDRPRPVLMIPLRRCGSHALRLRLNQNPDFFSPYPLHIVDFMPLVPRYGNLAEDQAYFRLVVDVIGLQAASMVKWKNIVFDPVEIFEAIYHDKRSVHRIVWELLLRAGEQQGAKVVMDKSLDSVHYAQELIDLFPNMLFLHVIRDPRAQVASMNRAIIHDYDTCLNALNWADAQRLARNLTQRYPDQVLSIRYEDFLGNQELVLRRICHFFEIDFLPGMLDLSRSEEAQQLAALSALWESNCFPPIATNSDKFKQQLSLEEIEVIETVAHDFMQLYGYQQMTAARASVSEAMLGQARERSLHLRGDAWKNLQERDYRDYVLRRYRADYLSNLARNLPQSGSAMNLAA